MTLLELLVLLVVAGVVGAIGQSLSGYTHGGCLTDIAVGFVGSLLGAFLARGLGLPEIFMVTIGGVGFPLVWGVIGAALFVALLKMLARGARPRAGT